MNVVEKEIVINALRETVWRYLSDPDLLAGWLMRNDFVATTDRSFCFRAQSNENWDGVLHCRLIDFDPPEKISFTWEANDIQGETLVTIILREENGETTLRLLHTNFEGAKLDREPIVDRHSTGWDDHLNILRQQVEEEQRGKQVDPKICDWGQFDVHVFIAAKPVDVIDRWLTIDGMESFFVKMMRITTPDGVERAVDESARPNDHFIWRWHNGRTVSGLFLQPSRDNEARFTFGESEVSVRTARFKDGTLLRLRQENIPDTETDRMHVHVNCRASWVYFLTVLKTLMETGVDCRDKTRETGAIFSTYFDPAAIGVAFD